MENSNLLFEFLNFDFNFTLFYIILPFGISFYTFETISYTVDVYRGILKPEKKFLDYLLFVTFFPKLVAGPIQRANELIPQFKKWETFNLDSITYGIKRILYGLFLKVVFADNISPLVDEMYLINFEFASAVDVFTMSFLFGFQIYFDFSAYSHIALGTAKLFGINIPENFNFPYIAVSLKDFWKRWHISLSAWIRDYLYLPLSGVKVLNSSGENGIGKSLSDRSKSKSNSALFLTWAIMGIWHGANWTFLFWGLFHAFFIYLERIFKPLRDQFKFLNFKIVNWGFTLVISMLSWIPFRANS
ncbi:MBOAT family protein, partial [Flavobacteriaceae bacterium]|nr:MBOAT family protein [Flavobacteriaceae bacterium]